MDHDFLDRITIPSTVSGKLKERKKKKKKKSPLGV